MIRELSELGKKIREENAGEKVIHDAIKDEPISIDLVIKKDGSFHKFEVFERIVRPAEAITAKKGKARLLLDKAEEVLCYKGDNKKHERFIDKLNEYRELKILKPVICFYNENKANGFNKALAMFEQQVSEKERGGNIAFRILNDDTRIHEKKEVYNAIIDKYEQSQSEMLNKRSVICSICGKSDYPVEDIPHGMVKKVPDGQTSGCALVSYNDDAYESYMLKGNLNSSICTSCARTYTEGLNWLMSNGNKQIIEDKKGKQKEIFRYTNRKNFGSTDTAFIYWTRNNQRCRELDFLDEPEAGEISALIESVTKGDVKNSKYTETDYFYSCTLSGSAARIAVRDWIEMSLFDLKKSIARWFEDIAIEAWGDTYRAPLYRLVNAAQNEKNKNETTSSRIAVHLWHASLKNTSPPLWILTAILKRIRIMENTDDKKSKESITPERAALIRLILNRNNKGGIMIKEKLDSENTNAAYVCGRIFAVLESIQRAALGKEINAGIRERFFSFASTNPSPAFGRLMKMSQNHLTKLKGEKAGLAVILDKELAGLFSKINEFPAVFSLEEQGQFAIGYYHQKQDTFSRAKQNSELKDAIEDME
jgi:CRISPR-associated protein Csd1